MIQDLYDRIPDNQTITLAPKINTYSAMYENQWQSTTINDASKLNATTVTAIIKPTNPDQIKEAISEAKKLNKKITFSGARHSMVGQIVYQDSVHLSMVDFGDIQYNGSDKSVTVQSGATWKQIQRVLGQYNRSVRVMQDSNIFTVGGSLSVNAHGKDPRFGSIIEGVNWFKLIQANGQEITCSRTENPDIFSAAIDGMGLFGVMTDINLKTEVNSQYNYDINLLPTSELLQKMETLSSQSNTELIEAHVSMSRDNFMNQSLLYTMKKRDGDETKKDDVSD